MWAAWRGCGVFPPWLVYLAASGEAAGQLDTMLARAADYLEREFDAFTSTALAMLEPITIILMGCIVAVIILSILLPILQLQSLTGEIGRAHVCTTVHNAQIVCRLLLDNKKKT